MDISPDGTRLSASHGQIDGQQSLWVMETEALLAGDVKPVASFDFGAAVPEGFTFSPDGRYLFGSSYYTGVSNIFRYELATGELEGVSNTETGFFRPIPQEDGSLIVFHYTGNGFVPARIDPVPLEDVSNVTFLGRDVIANHPILREWQAGSPADIPLDDLVTAEGHYSPVRSIGLESVHPIIEGYKDSVAGGLVANFSDPLLLNTVRLAASYSPDDDLPSGERAHLDFQLRHVATTTTPLSGTWTAGFRLNDADFYDLFGPTEKSLKGHSISLGYEKTLIYDEPRRLDFSVDLTHYADLDRLPTFQNVAASFDELTRLKSELAYSNVRSSLGHVDDEKGFKWRVIAAADRVNNDTIPKVVGEIDLGFALPIRHSSIWWRNSAGFADGDRSDPNAKFFFGGFGNNYVDRDVVKRYREFYGLPGFELNEVGGRTFFRSMLEWNLPPVRFSRVGNPDFYVSWARPALFATFLSTDPDNSAFRRTVGDAGVQVDFEFTMLSRLTMTLSLGYAVGFGEGVHSADEFMISLKIL